MSSAPPALTPKPTRFLDAVRRGVLVVDGGMGTQIYERGVLFNVNYEELVVSRPELVLRIHEDYVRAGAQVVETNTFGANRVRLARHGYADRVREFNVAAAQLARKAVGDRGHVAGAIGPSGLVFAAFGEDDRTRVRDAFREQAEALTEGGADVLLLETMRQPEELFLAIEGVRSAVSDALPIVAHVSVDADLTLSDGTPVADIGARLRDVGCNVIGVNCSDGPQVVLAAIEKLLPLGIPLSAIPNAGIPRRVDDRFIYVSTPEYFGVFARRLCKLGVRLIGGCCGTTPEHVRRMAAAARMEASAAAGACEDPGPLWVGVADSSIPPEPPVLVIGQRPVATAEKSKLASKIGKKFVVSVEVNPPVGVDPTSAIQAAKMLVTGGVDIINIADGARAQARMSNLALAVRMQEELGVETLLHVCGRDRNLLGQVAHLLGAHALGIRNLVVVTGDPPKMGDFPDATAVYDLDSIGILRLASRLNAGIDPGGKPLGGVTSFFCATGAEPAALNYEREMERLKLKKRAGAELIMTQPVYDPNVLDRFLKDVEPLGLPVLVGILPLASHKNAEFLHNEVPGMQIPRDVRDRMQRAGSGPAARKEGVAIAREMLAAVRNRVAGAYIMPPLGRYELALEVMDGIV
ncbi:bifunctional homocysteine S-methyltransferase/methylenetetrahydrofolate reductase [Polyangium mundeleinium]|uniref:Bifunctional homocysteine S-methyltransferase/methylenetetrahydrofolate reductase n=1 Tax=Polyangium mundeleinium TaxID=2995306 RepID=A0ABT5F4M7_9BACT|nr:bifunctional homocysteine S-methyltransferase/methylenetetrahydrofolate reductase [Polyangium mundeleinium]MDC0748951.1 bifunctional homocysteine S-methyltransferase/methylenetetrahydrofolate reductase [Polyangium mundeleinium]